jgi:Cu+-exporting ATPase
MASLLETTSETATNRKSPATGYTQLAIDGMTCGNCARHVTQALQSVPGVRAASVSLDSHQATVSWVPETPPDEHAVVQAVVKEGFGAQVIHASAKDRSGRAHPPSPWTLNLAVGIPITLLLMLGEWVFHLETTRWFQWCSFVLAAIVQVLAGAKFYQGAWGQLKAGQSNMDTLVALGSSTAFLYSVWALFQGGTGHLYFMEAASIITLVSLGHWMESRASSRASSALHTLLNLAPPTALKQNPNGTETEVPVSSVDDGDRIVLRPGDCVPIDGIVLEGTSAVDESMLTGESIPVDKSPAEEIYTGTMNLNGRLIARVTATGEHTALANIVAAVQRAQTSRAKIQRLGDRVSSVFVPIVVAVAVVAALWWGLAPLSAAKVHEWLSHFLWPTHPPEGGLAAAFIIASAILIIACPCAMGLATPAAIMVGSNVAARRGILIRDGVALERAGQVTAVVFDKTGTLTVGKPAVVATISLNAPTSTYYKTLAASLSEQDAELALKRLASALGRSSTHPISQVFANMAVTSDSVPLSEWREVRGSGVWAKVRGSNEWAEVRLGSVRWLQDCGIDLQPGQGFFNEWSAQGATLIGLAENRVLLGLFALKDTVKPGAAQVIQRLQQNGLSTFLVTGDNSLTAASIAQQAGIPVDNVFAEVRPEAKAELVRKLQSKGERIAFVGDGINDAPALEQADLGIAVSRASDIAREAADIILLKSGIEAIPESLGLARATLTTIKQNLFWAFFYNALGIPLAALGFMSPILCAAAMGLSDLVVIGNALRLNRWKL